MHDQIWQSAKSEGTNVCKEACEGKCTTENCKKPKTQKTHHPLFTISESLKKNTYLMTSKR